MFSQYPLQKNKALCYISGGGASRVHQFLGLQNPLFEVILSAAALLCPTVPLLLLCPALSCSVLLCPAASYPALFCPTLSCSVLFCSVLLCWAKVKTSVTQPEAEWVYSCVKSVSAVRKNSNTQPVPVHVKLHSCLRGHSLSLTLKVASVLSALTQRTSHLLCESFTRQQDTSKQRPHRTRMQLRYESWSQQDKAELSKTEQNKADQSRTEQDRAGQSRTGQNRTADDRTEDSRTKQDRGRHTALLTALATHFASQPAPLMSKALILAFIMYLNSTSLEWSFTYFGFHTALPCEQSSPVKLHCLKSSLFKKSWLLKHQETSFVKTLHQSKSLPVKHLHEWSFTSEENLPTFACFLLACEDSSPRKLD